MQTNSKILRQTAFDDTSCDDPHMHVHPESMIMCCKLALDRVICAVKNKKHHRTFVVPVQCEHSMQGKGG